MRTALLVAVCVSLLGCQTGAGNKDAAVKIDSDKRKISYSLGFSIGKEVVKLMKQQTVDLDTTAYLAGFKSVFTGTDPVIPESGIDSLVTAFQQAAVERHAKNQSSAASVEKEAGTAFLADNKTKVGVVELPSGLQYKVIKKGSGKSPKATDKVTVHYAGRLLDGTEFDSSIKRGEPATFPLNGVIAGWTEGLQLMKVGAKYELYIPSDLAYGDRSNARIPGGSTLIFEVELISID